MLFRFSQRPMISAPTLLPQSPLLFIEQLVDRTYKHFVHNAIDINNVSLFSY